jgi:hypothetical protein
VTERNKRRCGGLGTAQGATSISGANQKVILMTIKQHEMGRGWAWARLTAIALIAFGLGLPAFAALGGDFTSVQADQATMKASIKTSTSPAYTLHEIKTPMGTIVHEFVSADGKVFAVAWHGPSMPPMQQILGTYFQQFSAGVQAHHAAHVGRGTKQRASARIFRQGLCSRDVAARHHHRPNSIVHRYSRRQPCAGSYRW